MAAAALFAVTCLAGIALFQLALAGGAPLGAAAWGGQHPGVLPPRLRVASAAVALVVYPLIAAVVLAASGRLDVDWLSGAGSPVLWGLAGFFALGTVANAVSRSKPERWWAPVSLALAVCCAVLAVGL